MLFRSVINQFGPSKLALNEQMHVTETALENYGNFDITLTNDTLDTLDNKIYNYLDSEGE